MPVYRVQFDLMIVSDPKHAFAKGMCRGYRALESALTVEGIELHEIAQKEIDAVAKAPLRLSADIANGWILESAVDILVSAFDDSDEAGCHADV